MRPKGAELAHLEVRDSRYEYVGLVLAWKGKTLLVKLDRQVEAELPEAWVCSVFARTILLDRPIAELPPEFIQAGERRARARRRVVDRVLHRRSE